MNIKNFFLIHSLTWIDHDTIDKPVEEFGGMFSLTPFFFQIQNNWIRKSPE